MLLKYVNLSHLYLLQANKCYNEDRCKAFQCDITQPIVTENVPQSSVDFCSLIFVLSAIHVDKMVQALKNLYQVDAVFLSVIWF